VVLVETALVNDRLCKGGAQIRITGFPGSLAVLPALKLHFKVTEGKGRFPNSAVDFNS
jgi:hypothetical protein